MSTLQEATDVLRAAEARLRELIAQAAAQSEYENLPVLAAWAKHPSTLLTGDASLPLPLRVPAEGEVNGETESLVSEPPPQPASPVRTASATRGNNRKKATTGKSRPRSTGKKGEYPKFYREG